MRRVQGRIFEKSESHYLRWYFTFFYLALGALPPTSQPSKIPRSGRQEFQSHPLPPPPPIDSLAPFIHTRRSLPFPRLVHRGTPFTQLVRVFSGCQVLQLVGQFSTLYRRAKGNPSPRPHARRVTRSGFQPVSRLFNSPGQSDSVHLLDIRQLTLW